MTFRRFSSSDPADIAGHLNRLGDDLEDTITNILGARVAAASDPTGVLAKYADMAQKAWDGLGALTSRVTTLETTRTWTQGILTPAPGWTLPGSGAASWAPIRAEVRGRFLSVNGAAYKAGGASYTAGEHICTVDAGYRPAYYWQFPRGAIDSGGKVYCQETGTGGWVAVCFTVPIA